MNSIERREHPDICLLTDRFSFFTRLFRWTCSTGLRFPVLAIIIRLEETTIQLTVKRNLTSTYRFSRENYPVHDEAFDPPLGFCRLVCPLLCTAFSCIVRIGRRIIQGVL